MMMNLFCFTQTTFPKLITLNNDTLICFTTDQAKVIAKDLTECEYNNELVILLETNTTILENINKEQNSIIDLQEAQIKNYDKVVRSYKRKLLVVKCASIGVIVITTYFAIKTTFPIGQ